MGEGDKGSRQANGSSGAAPCHRRRPGSDVGEDEEMPPGDLARLLAAVGVLLGSHAASELVVVPREEMERREYAAYGQGWRDAAAQYHRPEWAEGLPAADADDRTPGQAAVIPFRRRLTPGTPATPGALGTSASPDTSGTPGDARRDGTDPAGTSPSEASTDQAGPAVDPADPTGAAGDSMGAPDDPMGAAGNPAHSSHTAVDPADPRTARATPSAPGRARSTDPAGSGPTGAASSTPSPPPPNQAEGAGAEGFRVEGPRADPSARPRSATPSRPPAFAPKNRRSKVPTIPRLPRPRRQGRPDGQES